MRYEYDYKLIEKLVSDNGGELDLWICDYRMKQSGWQVLRDIPPTKVKIKIEKTSNYTFKISYCLNFYPYTKTGKISKNKIEVSSKAGYDYSGTYIFLTEDEAINQYNSCIYEQIQEDKEKIADLQEHKIKLESKFINTDLIMETLIRN